MTVLSLVDENGVVVGSMETDGAGGGKVSVSNIADAPVAADRHDANGGVGANASDVLFSPTDLTNFNEHILEVTSGVVDVTVAINSGSTFRDVFWENMAVLNANLEYEKTTGAALPVGIYRLKGNFHSIKAVQNGASASAADLDSYCK